MYSLGNGPKLDPSHLAESFLSPTALDKSGAGVRALTESLAAVLPVGHAPLWGGETAAANNGGQSGELPSSEVVTPPLHRSVCTPQSVHTAPRRSHRHVRRQLLVPRPARSARRERQREPLPTAMPSCPRRLPARRARHRCDIADSGPRCNGRWFRILELPLRAVTCRVRRLAATGRTP